MYMCVYLYVYICVCASVCMLCVCSMYASIYKDMSGCSKAIECAALFVIDLGDVTTYVSHPSHTFCMYAHI